MTTPEQQEPAVPTCTAAGCNLPQAPGSQLCALDGRRLGDWLAQIGTEYELLSAVPSMQGREVGTVGGTTLAAQRNPGRLDVIVLRDRRSRERSQYDPDGNNGRGVLEILAARADEVRRGRELVMPVVHVPACPHPCMHRACLLGVGHAVPVPLTVARERKLLAVHLPWILGQDWAGEFFDEMRALWGLLRSANGHGAPGRVHRLQTPCTACGVRAVTHRPGQDLMQCQSCGAWAPYLPDDERMSA